MISPSQLENIPNNIVDLYSQLEEFIILDFSRRLKKVGSISSTAEWQKERASILGIKNIENKVASILKLSDEEIERLFPNVALASFKAEMEIYKQAKLNTIDYKSKAIQDYIRAAIRNTKGDIENITQSMGFADVQNGKVVYKPIAKFYQEQLNLANVKIQSGVSDYNSAIKQAVKKISSSGLRNIIKPTVEYPSGWSNQLDVAVRRAVLTGTHQMNQQMTDFNMEKIINNPNDRYVETTAHGNARPSHQVWQGKVFKLEGSSKDYPNLAESTGLGTVTGLLGAFCRHNYFPYVLGASVRTYTEKQLKELDTPDFSYKGKTYTGYEATQQQRKIETAIRNLKREALGYKETGLTDDLKATNTKISLLRKEYKQFSEASGVSEKKYRLQI